MVCTYIATYLFPSDLQLGPGVSMCSEGALFYSNLLTVEECSDAVCMHHLMLNVTQ